MIEKIQQKLSNAQYVNIEINEFIPSSEEMINDRKEGAKEYGINLGTNQNDICSLPDKFHIAWQYDLPGSPAFGGEICIVNPIDACLFNSYDTKGICLLPDNLPKSVFDDHPISGDGSLTLISLNETSTDFHLYYLLGNSKIIPLNLSITQYMELLPITMGYSHWQLNFCKNEFKEAYGNSSASSQKMFADLKKLFPNENYQLMLS